MNHSVVWDVMSCMQKIFLKLDCDDDVVNSAQDVKIDKSS